MVSEVLKIIPEDTGNPQAGDTRSVVTGMYPYVSVEIQQFHLPKRGSTKKGWEVQQVTDFVDPEVVGLSAQVGEFQPIG